MVLFAFLASLLLLPPVAIVVHNGGVMGLPEMTASALGVALLLCVLAGLVKPRFGRLAAVLAVALLLAALFVRTLLAFVYDFSGKGFDSDFFLHVNGTSLSVGWFEYRDELVLAAFLAVVVAALGAWLVARQRPPSRRIAFSLLPLSLLLVWFGADATPEVALAKTWFRYAQTGERAMDAGTLAARERATELLAPVRGDRPVPVVRSRIEASVPDTPLNLVLVYLESFNEMLTEGARHPGLTPRINTLKARHRSFPGVHSSAYLTIEGIANSQCGTLMDMEHANNALITSAGRLPDLPCLGDVLRAAGYRQVYLGGASLDFAGKGPFLREHGYDEVLGWEHWEARGHEAVANWGLADDLLLDEAFERIRDLHDRHRPFNVTILTLGTHLPGFVYDSCPAYSDAEDAHFLNAIHCTDYLFGRFVDRLEAAGILKDTVLFAQADHGVFESPDMRALFGDDVEDTRLVTLLAAPPSSGVGQLDAAREAAGSSVDTVATLLDLLGVDHNVEFVLARSRFEGAGPADFHLTRRKDFVGRRQAPDNLAECETVDDVAFVDVPLDACEKAGVMKALRALNLTYANLDPGRNLNRVCALGASIELAAEHGVQVTWGEENLSGRFYHRGTRFAGGGREGVYAVLLDARDNVRNALFFGTDNEYDLWRLKNVVESPDRDGRALFVVAADIDALEPDLRRLFPNAISRGDIAYGEFRDGAFERQLVVEDAAEPARLAPGSCEDGARRL